MGSSRAATIPWGGNLFQKNSDDLLQAGQFLQKLITGKDSGYMCLTISKGCETSNEHVGIRVRRGDLAAESLTDPQAFALTPRTVIRKDNQVVPSLEDHSLSGTLQKRGTPSLESRRGLNE